MVADLSSILNYRTNETFLEICPKYAHETNSIHNGPRVWDVENSSATDKQTRNRRQADTRCFKKTIFELRGLQNGYICKKFDIDS